MVEIPTVDQIGGLEAIPPTVGNEARVASHVERYLIRLGFSTIPEARAAAPFPGLQPKARLRGLRGEKADPDARRIDLLAFKEDLTLIIEVKNAIVEHGLGQLLLYGEIYRNRIETSNRVELVLAAPDFLWHPRLPAVCHSVGVTPWQLWTGRL